MKNAISLTVYPFTTSSGHGSRFLYLCVCVALLCFAYGGRCQTPLVCGQTASGATTASTQTNTYTFTGSAGQMLLFAFYWGSAQPGSADIYFPGATAPGVRLTATGDANATNITLPSSGTYTVAVHSSDGNSAGAYDLTFQSTIGGGCSGNTLPCGQPAYNVILAPTQMDSYEVVASAQEPVTLSVGQEVMDVYDPNGTLVLSTGSTVNYSFPVEGIFTVLVHSSSYAGTGEYSLLMSPVLVNCAAVPKVTVAPTNPVVAEGSSVMFIASAAGPAPLFYQWSLDSIFIAGATNSTYVIAQAQINDAGSYTVTVNNPGGSATAAPTVLTVTTNSLVAPILAWPNPAAITYGTPLTTNELDATASWAGTNVPGNYSYTPPSGAVLIAGARQSLSVVFTPSNATAFANGGASVLLTVLTAPLVATTDNASRTYGAASPAFAGNLTAPQNHDNITVSFSCGAISNSPAGSYPIVPILNDPGDRLSNYAVTTNEGVLTITPAPLTITAAGTNKQFQQNLTFTGQEFTSSGLQNGETIGSVTLTSLGAPASATNGMYDIIPSNATGGSFSPADYNITYVDGILTVTNADVASLDLHMYVGLNIVGPVGAKYAIQAAPATNATAWTTLTNITLATESYIYIDLTSVTNANQLYQLIPAQ